MGIPYYYFNIINKNRNIVRGSLPKSQCDRLFLDFNSIIHPISANVVKSNYSYQTIFQAIFKHTLKIIDCIQPKHLVYIAIDGVAPYSKIQQQRKRRYMSGWRNKQINMFKNKKQIPTSNWDSNCISPGTEFMKQLDTFLKEQVFPSHLKVIISGSDERGEGEHKMIQYIKNNISETDSYTDVIYGLDADLIMLSLITSKTTNASIFLMREMTPLAFEYLDVSLLQKEIEKVNQVDIIDYIALCFLVGNDFLPSLSFLKIRSNAIDILIDVYKKKSDNDSLIEFHKASNLYKFNQQFLIRIFEGLSQIEESLLKELEEKWKNTKPFKRYKQHDTSLDVYIQEMENLPLTRFNKVCIFDELKEKINSSWKQEYYNSLFSNVSIKNTCTEYIQGLQWNLNYYMNYNFIDVHKYHWCYNFNYAPCSSDIYKYLSVMSKDQMTNIKKSDYYISSELQLLMIIPHCSLSVLPSNLHKFFNDLSLECLHYFPKDFEMSSYLKTQLWECYPILPKLCINHIYKQLQDKCKI